MKRCLPSFVALCLLVEMLVISPPVFSQTAKQTKPSLLVETSGGLTMARIVTPQGIVRINLPDEIAAGDTISGTVSIEPAGSNEAEKAQNLSVLNGYVIDLGDGNKVKADQPGFTWALQAPISAAEKKPAAKKALKVLGPDGTVVGEADIPIFSTLPPAPANINIPGLGQASHNIQISGPFGNTAGPASTTIGGQTAPLLAASPRKIIVKVPNGIAPGPNPISVNSGAAQASGTIRVVRMNLSVPKTKLTKGEKTTLSMRIDGLQGIPAPVPVRIVTTGTVNMQGGNTQSFWVPLASVQPDGSYSQDFELTGIQAGGFRVDATVVTSDPGPAAVVPPPPSSTPSPTPLPLSSPTPTSGAPGPPERPLPGECGCRCDFETPGIKSNNPDLNKGTYTFEPVVHPICAAIDDTVCTSSVSYEWSVGSAGTAAYSIQAGTDKTQNLALDITRSGTLELSLTVKVKCSNGTKDFDCSNSVTETFNVLAPKNSQPLEFPPAKRIPPPNWGRCSCKSEFAAPNIYLVDQFKVIRPGEVGEYSFEPKVKVSCLGDLCRVKGVLYKWSVDKAASTAVYKIKTGTDKAKRLTIQVSKSGTLKLSVTVTATCTDKGTPCTSTGTGTFNVTAATTFLRGPTPANPQFATICKTNCDFAPTNIVSAHDTYLPDGTHDYTFEPAANLSCGENCEPPEVTYQWSVVAGSTAGYTIQAGTDKTKSLIVKVTRNGSLKLSVTVTAKCGLGTTPCTSTGTRTFDVFKVGPCTCVCKFNSPPILYGFYQVTYATKYRFGPNVLAGCSGYACEYKSIQYSWSIIGGTAGYSIVPGTDKLKHLMVIITKDGTLTLRLTVTVLCTDGASCTATSSQTVNVYDVN